jgi:hypothetical protein
MPQRLFSLIELIKLCDFEKLASIFENDAKVQAGVACTF